MSKQIPRTTQDLFVVNSVRASRMSESRIQLSPTIHPQVLAGVFSTYERSGG